MADYRNFGTFRLGEAISDGQGLAMNRFKLGEVARGEQTRAGLEQAIRTGDDTQFKQQFPIEAQQYGDVRADRRAKQFEQQKAALEDMHSLLMSPKDQPSLDMALQAAQARGYDTSKTPKVFGPEFLQYQKMAEQDILGVKGSLEMKLREDEKIRAEKKLTIDERRASASELTAQAAMRRAEAAEKSAESGGKPPKGYRYKEDGTLEPIPGGEAAAKVEARQKANLTKLEQAKSKALTVQSKIDEALGKTGFFTTGLTGSILGKIPGTSSYDLDKTIDTIKANIGFQELADMRAASPTGGALGQIAVRELEFLQAAVASLEQGQSREQLETNLKQVKAHFDNWKNIMEQSYGGDQSKPSPSSGQQRNIVRTGTSNGRKVVQYDDGTVDYAD